MDLTIDNKMHNIDWQLSKQCILERIGMLHSTKQWSDCTFTVGYQEKVQVFHAHRLILASSSPVFEAMCYGPLAERDSINVSDIEPSIFKLLLLYIYTDSVVFNTVEEAIGVLYAAKKYMLPHLSQKCHDYVLHNLSPNNVLLVYEFAEEIQEVKLMEPSLKVMCGHTKEVLKTANGHMSLHTLNELLSRNEINVSEIELFESCLLWAEVQCNEQGIAASSENVRNILKEVGAFHKIRFLSLTLKEFSEGPEVSGILMADEIYVLKEILKQRDSRTDSFSIEGIVPKGICRNLCSRGSMPIKQYYCARKFLKTAITVSGNLRLLTKVSVDKSVTVCGVRIFTRLVPPGEFNFITDFPKVYNENLELAVIDHQGNILSKSIFKDVVEYNTLATIYFDEPVRFKSNKFYNIHLILPAIGGHCHEYPLSFMSQTEKNRGIEFRFCDLADINGTGAFVRHLDMGFLDAIIYSL